jgi:hypothetical protein
MKHRAAFLLLSFALPCLADEGMWLFDRFPQDAVKQKYGAAVSQEFLDHLRLASARIGSSSGAFVSPSGLVLTNQHVVSACLASHNTLKDGFYASSPADEVRCPGLDLKVLVAMEDVTAQIPASSRKNTQQRDAAITRFRNECASTQTCELVSLYSGSRYSLYKYKRYADVRLVFAPEQQLAFFGHERDSITYLRYGLDAAFLRAYEDGKPAATPNFLRWSNADLREGDLVFASGNPKPTVRETTAAQLTFYRDTVLPLELSRLAKRIAALKEDQRIQLLQTYKSEAGKLIGLRDDRLVSRKTIFDGKIRRAVEADPKLGTEAAKVWDQVASAYKTWAPNERAYEILEADPAPGSLLFQAARAALRNQPAPATPNVDDSLEITFLTQYLDELKTLGEHGEKEIPVKAMLSGQTPQAAAEAYVRSKTVAELAKRLEPAAQRIRKKHDEIISSVEESASAQIAQYRYRLFGDAEYPDATGTPRVEFGVLKSYTDRAGVNEPYAATFSGLFYRQNNQGPYQVPRRWVEARPALDPVTPLDFVSTCDIGGGEAGSPTVNTAGELVGVIFDGNLESLPNTYLYTDEQARAVHVSALGIAEALEKIYRADRLLKELGLPSRAPVNP